MNRKQRVEQGMSKYHASLASHEAAGGESVADIKADRDRYREERDSMTELYDAENDDNWENYQLSQELSETNDDLERQLLELNDERDDIKDELDHIKARLQGEIRLCAELFEDYYLDMLDHDSKATGSMRDFCRNRALAYLERLTVNIQLLTGEHHTARKDKLRRELNRAFWGSK